MVCALWDERKTQTRRIPTRLLWCVRPGDRFYVREALRQCPEQGTLLYRADGKPVAAGRIPGDFAPKRANIPGMLMPRWASRLTLIVKRAWAERLHEITEADCIAEGPKMRGYAEFGAGFNSLNGPMVHTDREHVYATPRCWYRELWGALHFKPGQRWDDNPEIIALEFEAIRANIDAL